MSAEVVILYRWYEPILPYEHVQRFSHMKTLEYTAL